MQMKNIYLTLRGLITRPYSGAGDESLPDNVKELAKKAPWCNQESQYNKVPVDLKECCP
jgi:hypothetical protein